MGESARANGGAGWPPPRSQESSSFTPWGAGRRRERPGRTAAAHAPGALPPRSPGRAAAPPCPHTLGKGAAFRRRPGPWGWGLGLGQRGRRRSEEEEEEVEERSRAHRGGASGGGSAAFPLRARPRAPSAGGGRASAARPWGWGTQAPLPARQRGLRVELLAAPPSPRRFASTAGGQVHSGPRPRPLPPAAWGARVGALALARGGLGVREFSIRFFLGLRPALGFSL